MALPDSASASSTSTKRWSYEGLHQMSFLELHDPPQCQIGKVKGRAHWLIDYGPHADVLFGVVLDDTGAVWWVPTSKLTISTNWSLGRVEQKKLPDPALRSHSGSATVPYQPPPIPVGPDEVPIGHRADLERQEQVELGKKAASE